jgi:DNA-binding helix-hairpin-helix protein with protein kinase domain
MPEALIIGDRHVRLDRRIGRGGEGEVYCVAGDAQHAVKLYTVPDLAEREQKIGAMIRAGLAHQAPQVAFPIAVARTARGGFAGFMMRLVSDHKPLHELYSPGSRKIHFPNADYRFLVRTALNISKAIASVHRLGCVVGDINHSSILISKLATVALIDSDSFQVFCDSRVFHCRVGVPEYTPPELQGQPLGSIVRTANQDAFGLAVVIFQLLFMGRHPFIGTVRRGELPPLPDSIRDFRFVYTERRDVGMDQPPGTPALSDFPSSIGDAFEAAFASNTNGRPGASLWVSSLSELEKSLVQCTEDKLHWYPSDAADCLWCAMERQLGATLFLPYIPAAQTTIHPFDPGAGGFDLSAVWRQIETFSIPDRAKLNPSVATSSPAPSAAVRAFSAQKKIIISFRLIAGVAAVLLAVYIPATWLLYIPLAGYALFGKSKSAPVTLDALRRQYLEIEGRWHTKLASWHKRIGIDDLEHQVASLREAKVAYEGLRNEELDERTKYHRERRHRQLQAFLDGFEIRHSRIKGIGPAKQATLASYGIETAADVKSERILQVPGFGPATSGVLVEWRRKTEAKFVYNERPNDIDQQALARIGSHIQAKASTLRRTLLAGRANLENLANRTKAMAEMRDAEFVQLASLREQIQADIQYLGGTLPSAPPQAVAATVSSVSGSVSTPSASRGAVKSCPRCGSMMILRVARQGRWSGHQFWGCSRYPVCRGTRNT